LQTGDRVFSQKGGGLEKGLNMNVLRSTPGRQAMQEMPCPRHSTLVGKQKHCPGKVLPANPAQSSCLSGAWSRVHR